MSDDVTHHGDVNNDVTVGQANYSAKVFEENYQKQKVVKYTKLRFCSNLIFASMITRIITDYIIWSIEKTDEFEKWWTLSIH